MKAKAPARLVRWALRLAEFDFEIRYKKGTENSNADCLSRLVAEESSEEIIEKLLPVQVQSSDMK